MIPLIQHAGMGRIVTPWSPEVLFQNGELGPIYDCSDLSTMFQDAAGTVPCAVNSVVGRINDKRDLSVGTERLTTNPDFAAGAGWTLSGGATIGSGVLALVGAAPQALQVVTVTPGVRYEVTYEITRYVSGIVSTRIGDNTLQSPFTPTGTGTYVTAAICTATGTDFGVRGSASSDMDITLISVRAMPGYHATQETTSRKSILRQVNGIYSLEFDGVDDYLMARGFVMSAYPFSCAASMLMSALGTGGLGILSILTNSSNYKMLASGGTGPTNNGFRATDRTSGGGSQVIAGAVSPGPRAGAAVFENGLASLYSDGNTLQTLAHANTFPATVSLVLGAARDGATPATFAGNIYAAVGINRVLTDDERRSELSWLAMKAGAAL